MRRMLACPIGSPFEWGDLRPFPHANGPFDALAATNNCPRISPRSCERSSWTELCSTTGFCAWPPFKRGEVRSCPLADPLALSPRSVTAPCSFLLHLLPTPTNVRQKSWPARPASEGGRSCA
jgi:hypothetical protein